MIVSNSSLALRPGMSELFVSWNISMSTNAPKGWSHRPSTLSCRKCRTPHSEPAADKPFETKAFPQPSSAPSLCGARFSENKWQDVRKDCTP